MARSNKGKLKKASKKTASKTSHAGTKQNYISMQEEARNTEGRSSWRTDTQLRHRAVQFVSAGNIEPTQKLDSTSPPSEHGHVQPPEPDQEPTAKLQPNIEPEPMTDSIAEATTLQPTVQQRSPTPEDSSEDEVVFRGRRNRKVSSLAQHVQDVPTAPGTEEDTLCEPTLHAPDHGAVTDTSSSCIASSINESPDYIQLDDHAMYRDSETSDEDQILADYIANMDDSSDDDDSSSSANEDRDQDEDPKVEATMKDSRDMAFDSDSEDLHSDGHEMSGDLELDSLADFVSFGQSKTGHKKSTFASASAFADALELDPYYGFDIMDFSRPSLRKKAKKGSDHFNFEDIDDELEAEMLNAWNHDRLKKKSKKKEREQLRAQGLLGRRKNDPELKIKYADGIGIEDLKSEIRLFILSPKNSLSLPPMTKHRRMLVHDMAHVLRLTSKSRGKGSLRFPVLSKTTRTPKYTPKTITQLDRVLSREKFGHRALKAWDKTGARPNKAKAGQGNVSYMDGDVVGASAPEIGAENIGRAMLEKMGWSRGTALGATHNKGILLPVSHVVKNSKAGLG
ncbi:hypothetical protein BJX66DRAFT_33036 [Aspergillus keveii]|uniref:Protein SQS1 n=1 Tax=Aspergillus keveii TaxID=714993 RepID=A0ABR4GHG8_9EURO